MIIVRILSLLLVDMFVCSEFMDESLDGMLKKAIVNMPDYFKNSSSTKGELIDYRGNSEMMKKFEAYIPYHYSRRHKFSDGEAVDVVEKYFWGLSNGICIELGALDGDFLSQSKPLATDLGWQRIIIEGSPKYRPDLPIKSPDALAVSSAICKAAQNVHFVEDSAVGGIIEFMTPDYLKLFFPVILSTPKDQWKTLPAVKEQVCLPLDLVVNSVHVHHVNWFLLDVEGGELEILKSINFGAILFDVITVETEKKFRHRDNFDLVVSLLDRNGYRLSWERGRNSWFVRRNHTISSRPGCVENVVCRR